VWSACAYHISAGVGRLRPTVAVQRLGVVLQVGVDVVRDVRVVGRGDAARETRRRPPARVHRVVVVEGGVADAQLLVRLAQVGHAARVLQLGLQQEARLVLGRALTHRLRTCAQGYLRHACWVRNLFKRGVGERKKEAACA
jgi:hypothetical protein